MKSRNNPPKLYRPPPWGETVDILGDLKVDGGALFASIGDYLIELPLAMEKIMKPLVGQRISLLRTDEADRPYLLLVVATYETNVEGSK